MFKLSILYLSLIDCTTDDLYAEESVVEVVLELELVEPELVVPVVPDFVVEPDEDPVPDLSRLTETFAWAPLSIMVPP